MQDKNYSLYKIVQKLRRLPVSSIKASLEAVVDQGCGLW